MSALEIDTNDIVMMDQKENIKEPLMFNIIKYTVAVSPIIIPTVGLYLLTHDLLLSIILTAIIDALIVIGLVAYIIKTNKVDVFRK